MDFLKDNLNRSNFYQMNLIYSTMVSLNQAHVPRFLYNWVKELKVILSFYKTYATLAFIVLF